MGIFGPKTLDRRGQKWHFRALMKLKKLTGYDPISALKAHFLHRGEVELRRCGLIPDLFATRDGQIYVLRRLNQGMSDGQPTVKHHKSTLTVRHLVLDAYRAGWELEGELVKPRNGDKKDASLDNLEVLQKGKGRPRSPTMIRQILAVELVLINGGNIEEAAEELGEPPLFVEKAIQQWAPGLIANTNTYPTPKGKHQSSPIDIGITDD